MDTHTPLPPEIWEHTPPAAQERMVAQAAMLTQLRAEIAPWKATVAAMVQRWGRPSRHASQPPSADPPQMLTRPRPGRVAGELAGRPAMRGKHGRCGR